MTDTKTMATFTKLRSGEWGVTITGKASVGQTVTVTKKSGETTSATIAKVVWAGAGKSICEIASRKGSDAKGRCCKYCGIERYSGGFRRDGVCWDCAEEMREGILGHSY